MAIFLFRWSLYSGYATAGFAQAVTLCRRGPALKGFIFRSGEIFLTAPNIASGIFLKTRLWGVQDTEITIRVLRALAQACVNVFQAKKHFFSLFYPFSRAFGNNEGVLLYLRPTWFRNLLILFFYAMVAYAYPWLKHLPFSASCSKAALTFLENSFEILICFSAQEFLQVLLTLFQLLLPLQLPFLGAAMCGNCGIFLLPLFEGLRKQRRNASLFTFYLVS